MQRVRANGFDFDLRPEREDPFISGEIIRTGTFEALETALLPGLVREGDIVLDIGANLGWHTLAFARAVGNRGHVYAFEPDPDTFALLVRNIEANGLSGVVTPFRAAVTDRGGSLRLYRSKTNPGDHRVSPDPEEDRETVDVPAVAIDEVLSELASVDFVKIDIQGHEPAAFRGMRKLLNRSHGVMMLAEFWPYGLARSGSNVRELLALFDEMRFRLTEVNTEMGSVIHPADVPHLLKAHPEVRPSFTNLILHREPGDQRLERLRNFKFNRLPTGREGIEPLEWLRGAPIPMTGPERLTLYALVRSMEPPRLLEIGTGEGWAARLLNSAKSAKARLTCVDRMSHLTEENRAALYDAEVVTGDFEAALAGLKQDNFDFVLVDNVFDTEALLRLVGMLLPMMAAGGVIVFHDAHHRPVKQALNQLESLYQGRFVDAGLVATGVTRDERSGHEWGGLRLFRVRGEAGGSY